MTCGANRKSKLCVNLECQICLENSFQSNPKSQFWVIELNGETTPRNIKHHDRNKFWFYCDKCRHRFQKIIYNISNDDSWCPFCASKSLCALDSCIVCYQKSLASTESREEWNFAKNQNILPRMILKGSNTNYFFNCKNCSHLFLSSVKSLFKKERKGCMYCQKKELCNDQTCEQCLKNSFFSHPYSQNLLYQNPREIFSSSNAKGLFKCPECQHNFEATYHTISENKFCPYCGRNKLCQLLECNICFQKSFAANENARYLIRGKNQVDPRTVTKFSQQKFWFECPKCVHHFHISCNDVSSGRFCPFCSHSRLCENEECSMCFTNSFASHAQSQFWNHELNDRSPRNTFRYSFRKIYMNCNICDEPFETCPAIIKTLCVCTCSKNKTEQIIFQFLQSIDKINNLSREKTFDWCKSEKNALLRFDFHFFVNQNEVILECDGMAHFEDVPMWKTKHIDVQSRDVFKMIKAFEHSILIIRIFQPDIWLYKIDWKKQLLDVIENSPMNRITYITHNPDQYYMMHHQLTIELNQ